jgi:hypothetical protein
MTEPPRFSREPLELGRREAEEWLFAALEANTESYATDTDFGRRAAREAVLCVITFLDGRGLSGQVTKVLADLAEAVTDVENGILPEMLDPNSATQAGADGRQVWTRSAKGKETDLYLAAAAEALHRTTKRKLSTIFDEVARRAQAWPRISSGTITPGRVKEARHKHLPPRRKKESLLSSNLSSNHFPKVPTQQNSLKRSWPMGRP